MRHANLMLFATVISFCAGALIGCEESTAPKPDERPPYILDTTLSLYPLTVGDQCSFREDSLRADGSVGRSTSWGPYGVTSSQVVGGTTRYFDGAFNWWAWNGPGGVWTKFNATLDTTSSLMFKWPCKQGETWTTRLAVLGVDVQVTVAAVDAVIVTPARTDTCVAYTYRYNGAVASVIYMAPGFGWLYGEDYFTRSSMVTYGSNLMPLTSGPRYRYSVTGVVRNGSVP